MKQKSILSSEERKEIIEDWEKDDNKDNLFRLIELAIIEKLENEIDNAIKKNEVARDSKERRYDDIYQYTGRIRSLEQLKQCLFQER